MRTWRERERDHLKTLRKKGQVDHGSPVLIVTVPSHAECAGTGQGLRNNEMVGSKMSTRLIGIRLLIVIITQVSPSVSLWTVTPGIGAAVSGEQ